MGNNPNTASYSSKQLIALGRTLQALREGDSLEAIVEIATEYFQTEFNYPLVWVGLYDASQHQLRGIGGIVPQGDNTARNAAAAAQERQAFLRQRFALRPGELMEQVAIQQKTASIADLREEVRAGDWQQVARKLGIQGATFFPMRFKGNCVGIVLLGSTHWGVAPKPEEKARLLIAIGELSAAAYHLEAERRRTSAKPPHEILLSILSQLRSCLNLDQCLQTVVDEMHDFLLPTHTNVYWLERHRGYFWRRTSNRAAPGGDDEDSVSGIALQEVGGFCQALSDDQIVAVSEAFSSLRADATTRLMQQIQARSLLAAPILVQDELIGFLALEGKDARMWQEEEKCLMQGATQIIALHFPLFQMEQALEQSKIDQTLTSGVAQAIYTEGDWEKALQQCATALRERLSVDRFLVMIYDADVQQCEICYQVQPDGRRSVAPTLPPLETTELKELARSTEAIEIVDWEEDGRLEAWRGAFMEAGVRSLLLRRTSSGQVLEGIIAVARDNARTWNLADCETLRMVSQQIDLILHQWQMYRVKEHEDRLQTSLRKALKVLQPTPQLAQLDRLAVELVAQLLQCPLVALLVWNPGEREGRVVAKTSGDDRFVLNDEMPIPIATDDMLQWILSHTSLVGPFLGDNVSEETAKWLQAPDSQVWGITLHTVQEHQPTGVLLCADRAQRRWAQSSMTAVETIVHHLAWSRRYSTIVQMLEGDRQELEYLNWYKHRSLEQFYRQVGHSMQQLGQLQTSSPAGKRLQLALRQIAQSITMVTPLVKTEQWQLQQQLSSLSLAALLKRSLDRVQPIIQQRQLWSQVHDARELTVGGDVAKIDLILYEVLLMAVGRSPVKGRIDIWCRFVDTGTTAPPTLLDVSITDNGTIPPRLLRDFERGRTGDILATTTLDKPLGRHLSICRALLKQMGGDLLLAQLDDGRSLSRLVLPVGGQDSGSFGQSTASL